MFHNCFSISKSLTPYLKVSSGDKLYKLNTTYESLDYEIEQSTIRQIDQKRLEKKTESRKEVERWLCCLLIGISVGLTGMLLTIFIDLLGTLKIKGIAYDLKLRF